MMNSNYLKIFFISATLVTAINAQCEVTNKISTYQAQQEAAAKAASASSAAKAASSASAAKAATNTITRSNTTSVMSSMTKTNSTSVVSPTVTSPKTTTSTNISRSATSTAKPTDKVLADKNIAQSSIDGGKGLQQSNTSGPSDAGSYLDISPTKQ